MPDYIKEAGLINVGDFQAVENYDVARRMEARSG